MLLTCTYETLGYYSEETMFAKNLLANLTIGMGMEEVSLMWEA